MKRRKLKSGGDKKAKRKKRYVTECDNFGIDGFLAPSISHTCRNYAAEPPPQTPTFPVPMAEEGLTGTREIAVN